MIYFVTGGARSGKSSFAMKIAKELSAAPVYLATARKWDADFQSRIKRHQGERDESWTNVEEETEPGKLDFEGRVVVVDCVTLWLTNFFVDYKQDITSCLKAFQDEVDKLLLKNTTYIVISNEIGMGVHSDSTVGRKFTDLQGLANQYLASKSEEVIFMVSGIPVKIKSNIPFAIGKI